MSTIREAESSVTISFISPEQSLPLVITAKDNSIDLIEWAEKNKPYITANKEKYGAVLFRGFDINSAEKFEKVIKSTSSQAIEYLERSSPRETVSGNVYTSTSQPKESDIFLHTEQSFNLSFPLNIYFNCHTVAQSGGCTPLADTRKIFQRIPEDIRNNLIAKSYLYQRNFMKFMSVSWQDCYQTEDKKHVEKYCSDNRIDLSWGNEDITLTTRQIRPVVSKHPETNENCWFNHCTFFNLATLDPNIQKYLCNSYSDQELPNHTFYGDGSPIEPEVIEILMKAYKAEKVTFQWQAGDVLMVDNMLVAHGRESYEGERLVLTCMSEPRSLDEVKVA
ncbi:MAG: TauD/TfdA family dioxygenase [Colwellia sp.]|nr:TauD/TfdA family dioxygenase [Colwellia sp.]